MKWASPMSDEFEYDVFPSPRDQPAAVGSRASLTRQLRCYLERFLEYPFAPATEHAEQTLEALAGWGREAFDSIFRVPEGQQLLSYPVAEYCHH